MGLSVTGYNNLQIRPYELKDLVELKMVRRFNEHATLCLTGIIPGEKKDEYIRETDAQTPIEVDLVDEAGGAKPLFKGFVTNICVRAVREIYYLHLETVSASKILDIQLKDRSFQDINRSYTDLIKQVIADYPGADVIDNVSNDAKTGRLIVQYRETDWQLLIRLASHFNSGLIPATDFLQPKFYFGAPDGEVKGELDNLHYSCKKNISDYLVAAGNYRQDLQEIDFLSYQVETNQVFALGDAVQFNGHTLYIREVETVMQSGILKHYYVLVPKSGLYQNNIYNNQLIGASIPGEVIEVAKDKVRVHLEIDMEQKKEEAYWFPYASAYTAEGNSGWYFMPELGDCVRIYFPGPDEGEAVALSSVRKNAEEGKTNKVGNPDIKYLRTKSGNELMLAPGEILLSAKDGEIFLRMNDREGIEVVSKRGMKFIAKENVIVETDKKLIVSAKDEIKMGCKASSLVLNGNAEVKGQKIKSN